MNLVFFGTVPLEALLLVPILALNFAARRFVCRGLCPLGGLLAVLGARRRLRIAHAGTGGRACRRCDAACPLGLAPSAGEGGTLHCWNCGRCVDACPGGSLKLRWNPGPLDSGPVPCDPVVNAVPEVGTAPAHRIRAR